MNIKKAVAVTAGVGAGVTGWSLYLDRPADKTKEFENKIQMMADEAEKKEVEFTVVAKEKESLRELVEKVIKYPYYDQIEDITSLVIDYDTLWKQYVELKKKCALLTLQLDASRESFNSVNQEYAKLVTKLSEPKQKQIDEAKAVALIPQNVDRVKELEGLLETSRQESIDKGKQLETLKKQLEAKVKELADSVLEKDDLEEEIQSLKSKIETLKEEVQSLTTKLENSGSDSEVQGELDKVTKQLDEMKKQLQVVKEENNGLKSSIKTLGEDMDKLEKEKDDLQDRYDEQEEELQAKNQWVSKLESSNNKLSKLNVQLQAKNDELSAQVNDNSSILDENADLNVRLDGYAHKNQRLETEIDNLKTQLDKYIHRNEGLAGGVDKLKSENARLTQENRNLVDRNNSLDTMVTELQDKLVEAYKIIRDQNEDNQVDRLNGIIRRQWSRHRAHIRGVDGILSRLGSEVMEAIGEHRQMSRNFHGDTVTPRLRSPFEGTDVEITPLVRHS